MRVYTLDECAVDGNVSRRSLEKQIADGSGPAVVRLSPRRIGVMEEDWRTWLLARRLTSPGQRKAEEIVRRHREAATTIPAQAGDTVARVAA